MVDMAIAIAQLPPPPALLESLAASGYEYRGAAPHDKNDHWAMGGEGAKGHLGRAVLHITTPSSSFLNDAKAFVDFCNSPDGAEAFEDYANVKLEGATLASTAA